MENIISMYENTSCQKRNKAERIYALYKGDTFIDLGTKKYLANLLNCSRKYIAFLGTPANRRRMKKGEYSNALLVIRIED